VVHSEFLETVPMSYLDEDWGSDEVYAQFTLKDMTYGSKKRKKTNTVEFDF
jgi:hypothetical protein